MIKRHQILIRFFLDHSVLVASVGSIGKGKCASQSGCIKWGYYWERSYTVGTGCSDWLWLSGAFLSPSAAHTRDMYRYHSSDLHLHFGKVNSPSLLNYSRSWRSFMPKLAINRVCRYESECGCLATPLGLPRSRRFGWRPRILRRLRLLLSSSAFSRGGGVMVVCETSSEDRLVVERYFLMGVFGSGLALFGLLANGLLATLFLTRANYRWAPSFY